MTLSRTFTLVLLLLAGAAITFAQSEPVAKNTPPSGTTITVSVLAKGLRFTALGNIGQMRLEVFSPNGDSLYNSDFKAGNVQDWALEDKFGQPLPDGAYQCVVTVRDLSGRLGMKQGSVVVQGGQASLKLSEGEQVGAVEAEKMLTSVSNGNAPALTVLAHDGQQGRVVSGNGDLSFRFGNFFAGKDVEQMRLTAKGNLGLGVEQPQAKLDVAGLIRTSEGIVFPDGTVQTTAYVASGRSISERAGIQRDAQDRGIANTGESAGLGKPLRLAPNGTPNRIAKFDNGGTSLIDSIITELNGNIGIGTPAPGHKLTVSGGNIQLDNNYFYRARDSVGFEINVFGITSANHAQFVAGLGGDFQVAPNAGGQGIQFVIKSSSGNVGIGTTNPQAKLDVAGNLQVSGNAVIAGNIAAKYQDVAEWVTARQPLAAGTVVSLDKGRNNTVAASARAYDPRVAGVVSAQPGVILGEGGAGKVLVATTGRVKVKVDATRHPIKIGDLLVTSGKPGMAKKSQPIKVAGALIHRPGTIIGKALEPLAKGQGEILVLLSLQ